MRIAPTTAEVAPTGGDTETGALADDFGKSYEIAGNLGHRLTRDAVVTNNMPESFNVWAIRQNPDDSWKIEQLGRGQQVRNVDAVLVDVDGDRRPDQGARVPSSTIARPHYDLVQNELGALEAVPQGVFSAAGLVAANVANPRDQSQGFFTDVNTFYKESPYLPRVPEPR